MVVGGLAAHQWQQKEPEDDLEDRKCDDDGDDGPDNLSVPARVHSGTGRRVSRGTGGPGSLEGSGIALRSRGSWGRYRGPSRPT